MAHEINGLDLLCIADTDGKIVYLEHDDITCIIYKALKLAGNPDRLLALNLADKVIYRLNNWQRSNPSMTMHDVENMIKYVLTESGNSVASKSVENKLADQVN